MCVWSLGGEQHGGKTGTGLFFLYISYCSVLRVSFLLVYNWGAVGALIKFV